MQTTDSSKSSPEVLSPQLQRRLDRHFLGCSAILGASVALATGGAQEAKADIVYSGPQNIVIPEDSINGIYFDFDTGAFGAAVAGADANLFEAIVYTDADLGNGYHAVSFYGPQRPAVTQNMSLATASGTDGQTLKLSMGAVIGPSSTVFGQQNDLANQFITNFQNDGAPTGQWLGDGTTVQTGYVGFKFQTTDGSTHYGWFQISLDPNAFNDDTTGTPSTTVLGWAYNSVADQGILAGQIPEPNSIALALLGAGAAGLMYWRRKRAERTDVASLDHSYGSCRVGWLTRC